MKPMIRICALVAVVLFVLAGCATTEQKEQRLRSEYPNWDEQTIKKVANRDIEKGMTKEMVMAAYGKRGDVRLGDKMGQESWTYYQEVMYSDAPRWVPKIVIYFQGDKVANVSYNRYKGRRLQTVY